jgi:hypothetical protein
VGVGRIALAALVLAGLAAPAGLSATTPKSTARGAVTKLTARTIVVKGTPCRITTASPSRVTVRLYYVGAEVKIACKDGVLRAIDVLKQLPSITVTGPQAGHGTTLQAIATTGVALSQSRGDSFSLDVVIGQFSITALPPTSITVGRGPISLTCQLSDGSPDVGSYAVGSALTRLTCRNGVLTSLTPA